MRVPDVVHQGSSSGDLHDPVESDQLLLVQVSRRCQRRAESTSSDAPPDEPAHGAQRREPSRAFCLTTICTVRVSRTADPPNLASTTTVARPGRKCW